MKYNIVTIYPRFVNKGGAQDMAISIAKGLCPDSTPVVMYDNPTINEVYQNSGVDFVKLTISNVRRFHNSGAIFLCHHRKTTTILKIISHTLFFNKLRIIHVAHNTFDTLKNFTFLPKHVIAVSKTVKRNLVEYFKIPQQNVTVIYNGIEDRFDSSKSRIHNNNDIRILFIGRVDPVKRQLLFVDKTQGKINPRIKIYFAGIGSDYKALQQKIQESDQYIALGLIDIRREIYNYDYVCLFSEKEGLPLSLIEGCMFGKPLLTNDIPSSLEINHNGYNGYVGKSWPEIIDMINSLTNIDSNKYELLSKHGREFFKHEFDYNVMIEKYRKYIEDLGYKIDSTANTKTSTAFSNKQ